MLLCGITYRRKVRRVELKIKQKSNQRGKTQMRISTKRNTSNLNSKKGYVLNLGTNEGPSVTEGYRYNGVFRTPHWGAAHDGTEKNCTRNAEVTAVMSQRSGILMVADGCKGGHHPSAFSSLKQIGFKSQAD